MLLRARRVDVVVGDEGVGDEGKAARAAGKTTAAPLSFSSGRSKVDVFFFFFFALSAFFSVALDFDRYEVP